MTDTTGSQVSYQCQQSDTGKYIRQLDCQTTSPGRGIIACSYKLKDGCQECSDDDENRHATVKCMAGKLLIKKTKKNFI